MRWYPDRIPDWCSRYFKNYYWHGARDRKVIHLTFDDGPTPVITNFVLQQLESHNYKATFFLIGDRVQQFPFMINEITKNGHSLGNHTYHHKNAWKESTNDYLVDVALAQKVINSRLFRPPYGRIKPAITRNLKSMGYRVVLWDVLSGDFDVKRSAASCLAGLKKATRNGSIIVFHDSDKAFPILEKILPPYLKWLQENQYHSEAL